MKPFWTLLSPQAMEALINFFLLTHLLRKSLSPLSGLTFSLLLHSLSSISLAPPALLLCPHHRSYIASWSQLYDWLLNLVSGFPCFSKPHSHLSHCLCDSFIRVAHWHLSYWAHYLLLQILIFWWVILSSSQYPESGSETYYLFLILSLPYLISNYVPNPIRCHFEMVPAIFAIIKAMVSLTLVW